MRAVHVASLVLVVLGVAGCSGDLEKAQKALRSGNCALAKELHVKALLALMGKRALPEQVKAKQVSAEVWRDDVGKFLSEVAQPTKPAFPDYATIVQALEACTSSATNENILVGLKSETADVPQWTDAWGAAFYPEGMAVSEVQRPLIERTISQGLSMLVLTAGRNYTYEGVIVDVATGHLTTFTLYKESRIALPVRPGRTLLLLRSSVTFTEGEIWRSEYTVLPIDVPPAASLLKANVVTKVSRK